MMASRVCLLPIAMKGPVARRSNSGQAGLQVFTGAGRDLRDRPQNKHWLLIHYLSGFSRKRVRYTSLLESRLATTHAGKVVAQSEDARCFQGIVTPMLLVLRVVRDSIQDLKACHHASVGSSRDKCMISSASGVSYLGRRTSTISTVGRWAPLATAHCHEPLRR